MSDYMEDEITRLTNWVKDYFSEERRIQRLIDEAVLEAKQELKKAQAEAKKAQAEAKKAKAEAKKIEESLRAEEENAQVEYFDKEKLINEFRVNEIKHYSKANISPEKIIEMTGYSPEFVKEVLEEN